MYRDFSVFLLVLITTPSGSNFTACHSRVANSIARNPLVPNAYKGPVPGVPAGIDHGHPFLLGEQILSGCGHGVSPGRLDYLDLIPWYPRILVLDQPVIKPFQERDVIPECVLFDWLATVKGRFPLGNPLVDVICLRSVQTAR